MSWVNYDDILDQLKAAGFDVDRVDLCRRKRIKIAGVTQKGWYSLYEISLDSGERALVGSYGWWVGSEQFVHKFELKVDSKRLKLSQEQMEAERARHKAERDREEADQRRRQERAARQATIWWRQLSDTGHSAYMEKKGFSGSELFGARISPQGNTVIPVQDSSGRTHGLQVILSKKNRYGRDKDFTPPGLSKKGHFYQIGVTQRGGVVLLCEGFSTGASLHKATGLPVVVAFDAGNLMPVAQAIHKAHKRDIHILVCGDDDYLVQHKPGCGAFTLSENPVCAHCGEPHKKINSGKSSAQSAAFSVDGISIWPQFPADRPTDSKGPTDFNDLHAHPDGGLQAVRQQIEAALNTAGWRIRSASVEVASNGGAGDKNIKPLLTVDEACQRYSLIYGGRATLFDHWDHVLVPKSDVLDIIPDHGWREWKMRPDRKIARMVEVGFDPSGGDANIKCNLFGGWPTTPKKGECQFQLDLLEYLCSAENNPREVYNWVLKWLAYPIQNPGAKMKTALIFHGPQGVGKNLFFEAIMAIYGEYGRIVDQAAIEDKFNDWASRKLFMVADEVVARQELFHVKNKLKAFITGDWIRINPKNVASHEERNHVNVVFLSNEKQPLVLEKDDRRYMVVWVPEKMPREVYQAVGEEIANGGIAALHDYLLNLDLGEFMPWTEPIKTKSKQELIDISADSIDLFINEWHEGTLEIPFCPCSSTDLFQAYNRYCTKTAMRSRPQNQFLGNVAKIRGWSIEVAKRFENTHYSGGLKAQKMVVPCKTLLEKAGKSQPENKTKSQWITDCFFDFQSALGVES